MDNPFDKENSSLDINLLRRNFIKKYSFLIISLLFCSEFSLYANEKPAWITDPQSACAKNELCAVGEGSGHLAAQIRARQVLAENFEVSLSAQTVLTQSASHEIQNQVLTGQSVEEVRTRLEQTTDIVVAGAVIKETYFAKESVFALAVLEKNHSAKIFKDKMKAIDDLNQSLWKKKSRSDLYKILQSLTEREKLEQFYHFLTGIAFSSPISRSEIYQARDKLRGQSVTIYLSAVGDAESDVLKSLKHEVIRELLAQDYKIITEERPELMNKAQYKLILSLAENPLYINVKGFERISFELIGTSYLAKDSSQRGQLKIQSVQTARNKKQAGERALQPLLKDLRQQISELKLD